MLFTILFIVMSMNRFHTNLWSLLNNLLDFFVQLKEKMCKYHICFRFPGSAVYGKQLRQIYNHDINYLIYIVIYVTKRI